MQANKRKKAVTANDKNVKKVKQQSSIVNFFGQPRQKQVKKEVEEEEGEEKENYSTADSPLKAENEQQIDEQEKEEEPTKPEYFTTSMYTDEFDNMLEAVFSGEKFLFSEEEICTFDTFRSLKGFFDICAAQFIQ
jgi:tetrahydromethanopterin S-methyltransferase subunit A